MEKRKLLIVDDEIHYIMEMMETLKFDYTVYKAFNGQEALHLYNKEKFQVVLTDLKMPSMDGFELVEELEKFENPPVVIVQSIIDDLQSVVNLMQKGVYDYILKPLNQNELKVRVKNAFEVAELRKLQRITEKEREIRIAFQFNKLASNAPLQEPKEDNTSNLKLDPFLASLMQTNGFSMLSYFLDLMGDGSNKNSDYRLNQELLDMMLKNAHAVEKIKGIFSEIEYIRETELQLEAIQIIDLIEEIKHIIVEVTPSVEIKKQELEIISGYNFNESDITKINRKYFIKALKEILFNSFKFSQADSNISIIIEKVQDYINIAIINIFDQNLSHYKGVEQEYSRLIFEPFFRLSKENFIEYPTQNVGLGLTMVEKIIQKHNGHLSVCNIDPPEGKENEIWVKSNITLPIFQ